MGQPALDATVLSSITKKAVFPAYCLRQQASRRNAVVPVDPPCARWQGFHIGDHVAQSFGEKVARINTDMLLVEEGVIHAYNLFYMQSTGDPTWDVFQNSHRMGEPTLEAFMEAVDSDYDLQIAFRVQAIVVSDAGGKGRCITAAPASLVNFTHVLRTLLYSSFRGVVEVDSIRADSSDHTFWDGRARIEEGQSVLSLDLTAATDRFAMDSCRAVLYGYVTGLIASKQVPPSVGWLLKLAAVLATSPVVVSYGSPTGNRFDREHLTCRGIMMGNSCSWGTMNLLLMSLWDLAKKASYVAPLERRVRFADEAEPDRSRPEDIILVDNDRNLQLVAASHHPDPNAAQCGDDRIAVASPGLVDRFLSLLRAVGSEISDTNFVSEDLGLFTEEWYLRADDHFVWLPVVKLTALALKVHPGRAPRMRWIPPWSLQAASLKNVLGPLGQNTHPRASAQRWARSMIEFVTCSHYRELVHLNKMRLPLFLPRSLGGLGWIAPDGSNGWSRTSFLSQKMVAILLSKGCTPSRARKLRDLGKIWEFWRLEDSRQLEVILHFEDAFFSEIESRGHIFAAEDPGRWCNLDHLTQLAEEAGLEFRPTLGDLSLFRSLAGLGLVPILDEMGNHISPFLGGMSAWLDNGRISENIRTRPSDIARKFSRVRKEILSSMPGFPDRLVKDHLSGVPLDEAFAYCKRQVLCLSVKPPKTCKISPREIPLVTAIAMSDRGCEALRQRCRAALGLQVTGSMEIDPLVVLLGEQAPPALNRRRGGPAALGFDVDLFDSDEFGLPGRGGASVRKPKTKAVKAPHRWA